MYTMKILSGKLASSRELDELTA